MSSTDQHTTGLSQRTPAAEVISVSPPIQPQELMDAIIDGQQEFLTLFRHHQLSVRQAIEAVGQPDAIEQFDKLCRICNAQAQLLVSRYRMWAASQLIKLSTEGSSDEVRRKACVDLLKTELKQADHADAAAASQIDGLLRETPADLRKLFYADMPRAGADVGAD